MEFLKILEGFRPDPDMVSLVRALFREVWENIEQNEHLVRARISEEIAEIEKQIDKLAERIARTQSEDLVKIYEQQIEKLFYQKTAFAADFGRKRYSNENFLTISDSVLNCINDPIKLWAKGYKDQRMVLNMFFESKLTYNLQTGFGTPELPDIIRVLSRSSTSKDIMVEMPGVKPGSKKCHLKN